MNTTTFADNQEQLIADFGERVILPQETKVQELRSRQRAFADRVPAPRHTSPALPVWRGPAFRACKNGMAFRLLGSLGMPPTGTLPWSELTATK